MTESPAVLREAYLHRVCRYCQGIGYVERIPVKRRGHILVGPSRVKCLVCQGTGKPQVAP